MAKIRTKSEYLWKTEDKARAVAAYAAVGTYGGASALIGIPEATLRYWAKQDWWTEELHRVDRADTDSLKSVYTRIAKRATEALEDRLEHGDEVVAKDGSIVKKQIPGRELAIIAAVATDKRKQAMETPSQVAIQSANERLAQLVENFIRFSSAKQIEGEVKEIKDAE